ncbi:ATP-binding protein [Streptomyces sp. NBC_00138]
MRKLGTYLRSSVLVVDEVGYQPLERAEANLVFQVISQRYEKGLIVLTSTRPSVSGARSSATTSSPPRSSTASCTTTRSSRSTATATGSKPPRRHRTGPRPRSLTDRGGLTDQTTGVLRSNRASLGKTTWPDH